MSEIEEVKQQLRELLDNKMMRKLTLEVIEEFNEREQHMTPQKQAEILKMQYKGFTANRDYQEGDLVCWKTGLKNRRRPEYREPVIVLEILEKPKYDNSDDAGSPYYMEPLNVRLGLLNQDGDELLTYLFDGRRFRKLEYGEFEND